MADPKRNQAFSFTIGLVSTANRPNFRVNPTIAAGDFQVSIDGGVFVNLTTLPVVTPASSRSVLVSLSAAEMNGSEITVQAIDAAGGEWDETVVTIQTSTVVDADLFRQDSSSKGIVLGTVGLGSTTTSIVTSSLNPAASVTDQFKGRIVTFLSDTTTAALRGQATDITASTALGVLAVTALTTAPASGDTFVIT